MRFLLAPDSFKGSMSSVRAAHAMARALAEVNPSIETVALPMADGGEGTVDAILLCTEGEKITCTVEDPLGRKIEAYYGWVEAQKLAVIEVAQASGLPLLARDELNPTDASSYGTGELICHALNKGAKTVILGLGGSATVDAGVGMFQALGLEIFSSAGEKIERIGGALHKIADLDISKLDPRLHEVQIIVGSDVTNPLLGPTGAVYVFGPQKGVTDEMLEPFEQGMSHFSTVVHKVTQKDVVNSSGSGAAGGIGYLLQALVHVEFQSGLDLIMDVTNLKNHLKHTDVVLTGEGSIDGQSAFGKVPVGLGRLAKQHQIPVIAFAGNIGEGVWTLEEEGVTAIVPLSNRPMSLDESMEQAEQLLYEATKRVYQLLAIGKQLR